MKNLQPRFWGIIITLFISAILLFILYGNILKNANTTFFSSSGDGLQHYYQEYYHAKYDSSYFRTKSMNYPYGEMIFFTGSQPFISNTVKFISNNFTDITEYTIGVQNVISIISILIGALFLFLILYEFGINSVYAALSAIAIAFLSPQLDRFGGHYSLTYVFFIPLMIFLIIMFDKKKHHVTSIIILLVSYIVATTHMYFLAFFDLLLLFYWIYSFTSKNEKSISTKQKIIHISIQLIIPYILFLISLKLNDNVLDRTTKPWGFLVYRAFPESVFLPFTLPYGRFLHSFMKFHYIPWEGVAYTGLVGAIIFFVCIVKIFRNLFKRHLKSFWKVTDNNLLNMLFWASVFGLLYSFGIPFVLGLEFLVDYIGPFKQMRGIARFAWVFYYTINIVAIYMIWDWFKSKDNILKYFLISLPLLWLGYDAYLNAHSKPQFYNSTFDLWSDYKNEISDNQWVKELDINKYQALLPLPFYHIGSENFWIEGKCESLKYSSLVSIKTGLPIVSMSASRTSISQTLNLYSLVLEPYRQLKILDDVPNDKDILILSRNCQELKNTEHQLINHSKYIKTTPIGNFYNLEIDTIRSIVVKKHHQVTKLFDTLRMEGKDLFSLDSLDKFYYEPFDERTTNDKYLGKGSKKLNTKTYNKLYDNTFNINKEDSIYVLSFWIKDIVRDLYPRSNLEIYVTNKNGENLFYKNQNLSNSLITIDDSWGLIESEFILRSSEDILKITLWNDLLSKKDTIIIDELLIRPLNSKILNKTKDYLWINNRNYPIISSAE